MRAIVTTSDKYLFLLPEFAVRFNRYVSKLFCVDVLGYVKPDFVLPENFMFHSLGRQEDFGGTWTTGLIPFFNRQREIFLLLLDDYYITSCDVMALLQAEQYMGNYPDVMKFDVSRDRAQFPYYPVPGRPFMIVSTQNAPYRASLQAALWRPDYFVKLLVEGRNPWQFEIEGSKERMYDDATILGTTAGIMQYDNVVLKGKIMKTGKAI